MNWALDDAPMLRTEKGRPDTTARHVLQVLGEHARPDGTNSHPSILRMQYRTGYDRTTVQRALRRLEKGGLIRKDGSVDGRTRWRLAMDQVRPKTDWSDLEREEDGFRAAAAERKRRSRSKNVTHAESVTVTDSKGVTVTDAESVTGDVTDSAPSRHALKVRPSRTQCRPNHQQPSVNQLHKDSCEPSAHESEPSDSALFDSPASGTEATDEQQEDIDFAAFYAIYPRKIAKGNARKAFDAAVKRGAKTADLIAAAAAHRDNWARCKTETRFIPHPASWLNGERYDDELPAQTAQRPTGTNGYDGPWTGPVDHSAYYEDM